MIEEWKIVKDTRITRDGRRNSRGGLWEISNLGNIRKNGIVVQPYLSFYGYYKVNIGYIHKLVAQAFIPNPENKPQVDHIDTNPLNNHVSNLRWATRSENRRNPITQEKQRKAQKGKIPWNKGIPQTEETRRKNRESHIGLKQSEESIQKRINTIYNKYGDWPLSGYKHDEESRRKNREAHLNTYRVYDNEEKTEWHMEKIPNY